MAVKTHLQGIDGPILVRFSQFKYFGLTPGNICQAFNFSHNLPNENQSDFKALIRDWKDDCVESRETSKY